MNFIAYAARAVALVGFILAAGIVGALVELHAKHRHNRMDREALKRAAARFGGAA